MWPISSTVARRRDSWRSPPFGIESLNVSPTLTVIRRPNRGSRAPLAQKRCEPMIAIGRIGAPLRTARTPAPSLASCIAPLGERVPSGKIARMPPPSRTDLASLKASRSPEPRRTPKTPFWRIPQPKSGQRRASALPNQPIGRPSAGTTYASSSIPSALEQWLQMIRTGPDCGMFSSPSTVTRVVQAAATRRIAPVARGKNGSFLPSTAISSSLSLRHPAGGLPDRVDDGPDRLLEAVAVGVDDERVRRRPKRGDLAVGIDGVAMPKVGQDLIRLGRVGRLALHRPALGALLGRGIQEYLDRRVRQDRGPDIAAGHDDAATGGDIPLARNEGRTQLRNPGVVRNGPIHARLTNLGRDVPATGVNVAQSSTCVGHEPHLGDERHERRHIRRCDAALKREPRDSPIQQARVAEAVAESPGGFGADGALATRAGSVKRHDKPARIDRRVSGVGVG